MDGNTNGQPENPWQFRPGDTVSPGGATIPSPTTPLPQPTPAPLAPTIATQPIAPPIQTTQPAPIQPRAVAADGSVSWTASEFIAHHKSFGWFATLALAAAAAMALVWFITKDTITAIVIAVVGLTLGVYAARQPRQLMYQLDHQGLTIGNKYYSFAEFRSFSVVPEGAFTSIVFSPLKRFAFYVTIYYDPADEDRILDILEDSLPHTEHQLDPLDQLMRRIRF